MKRLLATAALLAAGTALPALDPEAAFAAFLARFRELW